MRSLSAQPLPAIPSPLRTRLAFWYPRVIVVVAAAFFAQYYTIYSVQYLNLADYVAGRERMPFQARELMRYPLGWVMHSGFLQRLTAGHKGLPTPALLFTEIIAFFCMLLSGLAAIKIYRWADPKSRAPWLPFALLIIVAMFDFGLTVPYGFPYDLPSLAFLGWGTYFVLTEQFWPLLPLFLFATWNRETALFLLLASAAVACYRTGRFNLRSLTRKDLAHLTVLSVCWVAITATLQHKYAANPTEAGSRLSGNLRQMINPILIPNILSASAFLLPYIWLKRDRIARPGLRACIVLLPFWVLILIWKGQILELRIYGDISVFVAVAATLIFVNDARDTDPKLNS